ncbi:MAG: 30S ribosomal protein S15 [Patescibacteria group bacterium]
MTTKAKAIPEAQPRSAGKVSARRAKTIKKFQAHDKDTGSTEVQVAVLSDKVNTLSEHLQTHKKDVDSRMGLLKMISQRRSLLGYLEKKNPERYKKLISSLGLRK